MTLRVANWSEHFENNRTRELKVMTWVPVPTKQDGDGYTQVMDHPQGAAHFGAWIAMLQVAAKCDERGTLVREGRSGVRVPHDAASLSRLTRIPARILSDAIARLVEIGWLEDDAEEEPVTLLESACRQEGATASQEGAGIPQDAAPSRARAVGQNKTEQEKRRSSSSSAPRGAGSSESDFDRFWTVYPRKVGKLAAERAWAALNGKRPDIETILAALDRAKRSSQWTRDGGQFIPHPATWLRQGRWEDSDIEAQPDRYRGSGKRPSHAPTDATRAALAKLSSGGAT